MFFNMSRTGLVLASLESAFKTLSSELSLAGVRHQLQVVESEGQTFELHISVNISRTASILVSLKRALKGLSSELLIADLSRRLQVF